MQACAVKMHINMSQEALYTKTYKKNAAPRTRTHTCLEKLFELLTWNVSFVQNKTGHLAINGMTAAV